MEVEYEKKKIPHYNCSHSYSSFLESEASRGDRNDQPVYWYICFETIRDCYITVYDEGIFYYYIEREGLYNKGYFREFAEGTYELAGKKITPQRIKSDKRSFQFSDGEVELNFKKIDEIPMITETVLKLAE